MNIRNSNDEFGLISKLLHWLIAVSIIILIAVGWYMVKLSDEDIWYWRLYDFHLTLGLALLIVVALKFIWWLVSPGPAPLPGLTRWERGFARGVHGFFLIAMVSIPLSGFVFVATNGEAIELYETITIPDVGELSKSARDLLSDVHYYLSYSCAALIVLHVMGALKHRYFDASRSPLRMGF